MKMFSILLGHIVLFTSTAHAITVDFESVPLFPGTSFSTQGFDVSKDGAADFSAASGTGYTPDTGKVLIWADLPVTVSVKESNDAVFDLDSFDLGVAFQSGTPLPATATVTGFLAGGGTVTEMLTFPQDAVLNTFTFDSQWDAITKFDLAVTLGAFPGLDNVVVTAVPLPPAVVLLISAIASGFGIRGFRSRG